VGVKGKLILMPTSLLHGVPRFHKRGFGDRIMKA